RISSGISWWRTKPPTLSGASTYTSSGTSTAARIAAICASVRSVGRLIVLAPSCERTRAAAGFAAGSITDTFACISAGSSPAARSAENASRTPMSAIRTLRKPCAAARRTSSSAHTTCSCPRAVGATTAPAGERAIADASHAAFGRANRLISTPPSAASCAISSSSASVWRNTPLPCDTRWTVTSSRAASSRTASRHRGPSVLGISTRKRAPSGKRFGDSGRSFRSPRGSPIEARKSRVSTSSILDPRIAQQPREQLRPHRQRLEQRVLVRAVRAASVDAQPVEHRHAEDADEVSVRPSSRRTLVEIEPELPAVLVRLRKKERRAGRRLERRPRPAARDREARAFEHRRQRGQHLLGAREVGGALDANVDLGLGARRDDVLARATVNDAHVEREPPPVVVEPVEREHLMCQLLDRAHALTRAHRDVRRTAGDGEGEAAEPLSRGLELAARAGRLDDQRGCHVLGRALAVGPCRAARLLLV